MDDVHPGQDFYRRNVDPEDEMELSDDEWISEYSEDQEMEEV